MEKQISTGKEYGSRLVFYLNYINSIGIEYPDADNDVVKKFINHVIYGGRDSANTVSMIPLVTYNTLNTLIFKKRPERYLTKQRQKSTQR